MAYKKQLLLLLLLPNLPHRVGVCEKIEENDVSHFGSPGREKGRDINEANKEINEWWISLKVCFEADKNTSTGVSNHKGHRETITRRCATSYLPSTAGGGKSHRIDVRKVKESKRIKLLLFSLLLSSQQHYQGRNQLAAAVKEIFKLKARMS